VSLASAGSGICKQFAPERVASYSWCFLPKLQWFSMNNPLPMIQWEGARQAQGFSPEGILRYWVETKQFLHSLLSQIRGRRRSFSCTIETLQTSLTSQLIKPLHLPHSMYTISPKSQGKTPKKPKEESIVTI
jgi:hypothetical protein